MNNGNLVKRSYLYFFVWFMGAGLQNIVPQLFLGAHYPERQEVLLSICLLSGAVASLMTIFLSSSSKEKHLSVNFVVFTACAIGLLFISLFMWQALIPFILAFLLLRGIIQYVYNRTDHYYVRMTGEKETAAHSRLATLFQLIGIMAGPLYFTIIGGYTRLNVICLLLMTFFLVWFILNFRKRMVHQESFRAKLLPMSKNEKYKPARSTTGNTAQPVQPLIFIIYILIMTTGIQLYSNNAILIVRDYYGLDHAAIKGGIMLTVLNASGIATVFSYPWFRHGLESIFRKRKIAVRKTSSVGHAVYGLMFLVCVMLLKWPFNHSYMYLIVLSLFTGCVYGLYWMKIRTYSLEIVANTQKKWVLTLFNYIDNFAMLSASMILFVTAILAQRLEISYLASIMTALIICFALSSIVAMCLNRKRHYSLFGQKNTKIPFIERGEDDDTSLSNPKQ